MAQEEPDAEEEGRTVPRGHAAHEVRFHQQDQTGRVWDPLDHDHDGHRGGSLPKAKRPKAK